MKRFYLVLLLYTAISICASAQIGYQVSLLNNATGEPRANERVSITVKITDSEGKTVWEETKNETSNDFGVLSMSVGNSETFSNADWSKLPFFIEASIDGRLIGKSQLLSVPVAEYAKKTGVLTRDHLCSKDWRDEWKDYDKTCYTQFKFDKDGSLIRTSKGAYDSVPQTVSGSYYLVGDDVIIYYILNGDKICFSVKYIQEMNALLGHGQVLQ